MFVPNKSSQSLAAVRTPFSEFDRTVLSIIAFLVVGVGIVFYTVVNNPLPTKKSPPRTEAVHTMTVGEPTIVYTPPPASTATAKR